MFLPALHEEYWQTGHMPQRAPSQNPKERQDLRLSRELPSHLSGVGNPSFTDKLLILALILEGDYYLAAILSSTLAKLVMRFSELPNSNDLANSFRAEAMLTMSSIIRVGQSHFVKTRIDEDSMDRIMSCFRALADFKEIKDIEDVFLSETKSAYTTMLVAEDKLKKAKALEERNKSAIQADDVIFIRQLVKKGQDKTVDEVDFPYQGVYVLILVGVGLVECRQGWDCRCRQCGFQVEPNCPVDRIFRSSLRGSIRQNQQIRHHPRCSPRQSNDRHLAKPVS